MLFFFFNDTATTEIYTLSLHDALPISWHSSGGTAPRGHAPREDRIHYRSVGPEICSCSKGSICPVDERDRKSTRLNSSHGYISYAVFCLKKKKALPCRQRVI